MFPSSEHATPLFSTGPVQTFPLHMSGPVQELLSLHAVGIVTAGWVQLPVPPQ
jgi:hypothetical protein